MSFMSKHMSELPQIRLHKFLFTLINAKIGILFRSNANKGEIAMCLDIIVLDCDIIKGYIYK